MSAPVVLRMDHVYKKFTKGERHDALRDLIPALTKRAIKSLASPPELRAKEFWALLALLLGFGVRVENGLLPSLAPAMQRVHA